jgi:putative oxidoreductase
MAELKQYEDLAALVARLFMGAFFCVMRLFHADQLRGDGCLHGEARPSGPGATAALAVIIELGGGLLILFGYQTRLVALGCAIYVLIAAIIAHRNFGDPNQISHFWKNMAIVGGFIALMVAGPGSYSVDGRRA